MTARIIQGDCMDVLPTLPENSVHTVCTSPPYFALRQYLPKDHPASCRELGTEPTVAAYIANLVAVFREVRRVLHPSGTVWCVIGDSYATDTAGWRKTSWSAGESGVKKRAGAPDGMKPKDLCLVPQRLAIALQDAGWYVRQILIYAKKSCMPESVTDRCTTAHEYILLLSKSPKYFFDALAIAEKSDPKQTAHNQKYARPYDNEARILGGQPGNVNHVGIHSRPGNGTRNARSVWTLPPSPFPGAHFATFPPELVRRAIAAGTSERGCCPACLEPWRRVVEREPGFQARRVFEGGLRGRRTGAASDAEYRGVGYTRSEAVGWQPGCTCDAGPPVPCTALDPFLGSGTTLLVADRMGRDGIGVELSQEYVVMARERIYGDAPLFANVEVDGEAGGSTGVGSPAAVPEPLFPDEPGH